MKRAIILCLLLAACNSGGGNNPPPIQGWTAAYSVGISRCDDFNFGELHYCIRQMNARIGQTIRMTFTISGTGTLYPAERADLPPATLRLFVASADLNGGGRWWCPTSRTDLSNGTQTVVCQISSAWTSVGGGLPDPGPPNGIQYVGFTMGGQYFAGHGVAANGPVHFHLDSYSIGDSIRKRKKK